MKVFSILLLLTILGTAMVVLAAPGAAPDAKPAPEPILKRKPIPSEMAIVEARAVFGRTRALVPDGTTRGHFKTHDAANVDDGPDFVLPIPKISLNERAAEELFKRQSCPANHWFCSQVNGCCQLSPLFACCDFGCCPTGFFCCGRNARCHRTGTC